MRKGALWLKCAEDGFTGPAARAVDEEAGADPPIRLRTRGGRPAACWSPVPDSESSPALDVLRRQLGAELGAVPDGEEWVWVTDFPLFEADPETGAPAASHHPFTMPVDVTPEALLGGSVLGRDRGRTTWC